MPFTFKSTAYHFPKAWTPDQRAFAETTLKYGVKTGARESDMIAILKRGGVSYRKTNMLADMSRAKAIEQSKSVGAYHRSESWFDALEKVRVDMPNKTRKEASAFMTRWKQESWQTIQEAELMSTLEVQGFDPSPKI